MTSESTILAGIRVLDFTTAGAGPKATSQLGMLGAEVLKLEPAGGNTTTRIRPMQGGISCFYTTMMANKRSVIFDAKASDEQRRVDLIKWADVLLQNLRPGSIDTLGFSYEQCRAINPRLVYVSISTYGEAGPLAGQPGVDPFAQAYGGWVSYTGKSGGQPEFTRAAGQIDHLAGSFAASAALLGLLRREEDGVGSHIAASLLGSAVWTQMYRIAATVLTNQVPRPAGSRSDLFAPDWAVRCGDGQEIAILARTQDEWVALCGALDAPELTSDARFTNNQARVRNQEVLERMIAEIVGRRAAFWWILQFTRANVPHALAQINPALKDNPQIVANEYLKVHDVEGRGRFTLPEPPWKFSRSSTRDDPPPLRGADTAYLEQLDATPPAGDEAPSRSTQTATASEGWLSGLVVGDATQGLAGPLATSLYAALGATVLKFEPPQGDYLRTAAPVLENGSASVPFLALNAGKQISDRPLDPSALDVLFIDQDSSWLGIDVNALQVRYPRLVSCRITANGPLGPRSSINGGELTAQVQAEYHSSLGSPEWSAVRQGADVVSASTAVASFQGTLAALWERRRSGQGQHVEVSLLASALFAKTNIWSVLGEPDDWGGHLCDSYVDPPDYGYRTADGIIYFNLFHTTEAQYLQLLSNLGILEDALADHRFDIGHAGRGTSGTGLYSAEFREIWSEAFRRFSTADIVAMINDLDGVAVAVNDVGQVAVSPQVAALDLVTTVLSDGVPIPVVRPPLAGAGPLNVFNRDRSRAGASVPG